MKRNPINVSLYLKERLPFVLTLSATNSHRIMRETAFRDVAVNSDANPWKLDLVIITV